MSDHTHDCPVCRRTSPYGYWPCDRDDCNSDDICLECQLEEKDAEIERLKAELEETRSKIKNSPYLLERFAKGKDDVYEENKGNIRSGR